MLNWSTVTPASIQTIDVDLTTERFVDFLYVLYRTIWGLTPQSSNFKLATKHEGSLHSNTINILKPCFIWWQFNVINRRPYKFLILHKANKRVLQQKTFILNKNTYNSRIWAALRQPWEVNLYNIQITVTRPQALLA